MRSLPLPVGRLECLGRSQAPRSVEELARLSGQSTANTSQHLQALLTRATIAQVTGDYALARRDCLAMRQPAPAVAAVCLAAVDAATGADATERHRERTGRRVDDLLQTSRGRGLRRSVVRG